MSALARLQSFVSSVHAGPVTGEECSQIESLLHDAWPELSADEGGMEPYKFLGRSERMEWHPPILTFDIERHGGVVLGSVYAEVQTWTVNVENGEALVGWSPRKRMIRPRNAPIDVGPLGEELAAAMREGRDDERLQWTRDRSKVRVLTSQAFPSAPKMTTEGRSKRLRLELVTRLVPEGWEYDGRWWTPPAGMD